MFMYGEQQQLQIGLQKTVCAADRKVEGSL